MRRTQLYLDDDLWGALHARARSQKTTVSELVRVAVRERYLGNQEERRKAMEAFIGIWRHEADVPDATEVVRDLRRGDRMSRLTGK